MICSEIIQPREMEFILEQDQGKGMGGLQSENLTKSLFV